MGTPSLSWISAPGMPLDLRGPTIDDLIEWARACSRCRPRTPTHGRRKFPRQDCDQRRCLPIQLFRAFDEGFGLAHVIATAVPDGLAIGLLLGNSVWHPIATLACMGAGRPSVPLNPRDPAQRLADIVTSARIPVLICQGCRRFIRSGWSDTASSGSTSPASTDRPPRSRLSPRSRWMRRPWCFTPRAVPGGQRESSTVSAVCFSA